MCEFTVVRVSSPSEITFNTRTNLQVLQPVASATDFRACAREGEEQTSRQICN